MNFKSIKKYQVLVLFCFSKKDNRLIRSLRSLYNKLKFSLWSINLTQNSVNLTQNLINPFSTNVPFMDKPGSCFLLAKCLKNICGRVTFFTLPQVFFKHFARPASLFKMSLFYRCFSNILLVKTNYLVSTWVEHWSKMG